MCVVQALLCHVEHTEDGEERCVCVALSKEHNPTIYEERMRIQRAGGTVRWARGLCNHGYESGLSRLK